MVILGLDAAWTPHRATGCAVIAGSSGSWTCLAACSSYEDFFRQSRSLSALEAAAALAGSAPDVVSVDMPLAKTAIAARRTCDNALSRAFAASGLGVHSSTPERPGRVSTVLMETLTNAGYDLAVDGVAPASRQVIEVYPHIAVMHLTGASYRVPYKVARAAKYWPGETPAARRRKLRAEHARILSALQERVAGISLELPPESAGPTQLKRFEDALDGVICAWIGALYLEGNCRSYGDATAAIWVPEPVKPHLRQ
jgi:predicted RNase H-like nuclease